MPLKWRDVYPQAECTEIVELKDRRCYKVLLTPEFGKMQTRYFAVDTGLHVATERIVATSQGKVLARMFMSDYKAVDGVLYPHRMEQEVGGQQSSVVIVDSIAHNVEIPKDKFSIPQGVANMMKNKKPRCPTR